MLGQSAAIARRPPHASTAVETDGSPDPLAIETKVAIAVASSAAIQTLILGIPIGGCYITVTTDTDCYIHFGPNASIPAASSTISSPMLANTREEFWINDKDAFFRVIRKTVDGVLSIRRSNL